METTTTTTTTLFENGNTYAVELRKETQRKPGKLYMTIDGVLHEVLSKTRTNEETISPEREKLVKPHF
ncbi:hypothetical protein Q73A0000_01385 [Kaistella flava (ex Peng et al. 2021)]|uniref:Uncharacterized protein n=1 Tax=Kaistella flava (ex Peng et al. 2021) TaxID=2038776 RepID=A0A7M2Y637_9FLAO|nr:hypothetical protein [Kaistella flava (ex Peng et al. 2021)]QOW09095.1 hypothetical protein Q73A0000_01385 [Kaistella flava (ex Peng et al. 2021)]